MMTRTTKTKLVAFVVITTLAVLYILVDYVQLPSALGYGRYHVTMELDEAGGLYPKAVVTYRGVDVGVVEGLEPTSDGVRVDLAIDDGTEIPADLTAEVHSTSAVGEQFVDLVPRGTGGPQLADGDTIPQNRTTVPVTTGEVLDNARALVDSVPLDDLQTTVDELGLAFDGTDDDLQVLLDSGMTLQAEASANLQPTIDLINQLQPVLDTQRRLEPEITSYARDLSTFTHQLTASDENIRALLAAGPEVADELNALYADLQPALPPVLTEIADTGEVLRAYRPGLEHTLIVFPAVIAAMQNVVPPAWMDNEYAEGNLYFKLSVNDPPVCIEGFEYADRHRDPNDVDPAPLPKDSYCKVARNDPRVVRGARNFPCPNNPARRAATAAGCGLVFDDSVVPGANPLPPSSSGAGGDDAAGAGAVDPFVPVLPGLLAKELSGAQQILGITLDLTPRKETP